MAPDYLTPEEFARLREAGEIKKTDLPGPAQRDALVTRLEEFSDYLETSEEKAASTRYQYSLWIRKLGSAGYDVDVLTPEALDQLEEWPASSRSVAACALRAYRRFRAAQEPQRISERQRFQTWLLQVRRLSHSYASKLASIWSRVEGSRSRTLREIAHEHPADPKGARTAWRRYSEFAEFEIPGEKLSVPVLRTLKAMGDHDYPSMEVYQATWEWVDWEPDQVAYDGITYPEGSPGYDWFVVLWNWSLPMYPGDPLVAVTRGSKIGASLSTIRRAMKGGT